MNEQTAFGRLLNTLKTTGILELLIKIVVSLFNKAKSKNPEIVNIIQYVTIAVGAAQWLLANYNILPISEDAKNKILIVCGTIIGLVQFLEKK